jgi:hypothetical protein
MLKGSQKWWDWLEKIELKSSFSAKKEATIIV